MLWRALDEMRIAMGMRPRRGGSSDGGGAIAPAQGVPLDAAGAEKQIGQWLRSPRHWQVRRQQLPRCRGRDHRAHLKKFAVQN